MSFAQSEAAAVSGRITDQQGAMVFGAKLIITNIDTNLVSKQTSNREGLYLLSGLKPGRYRITVTKDGFSTINLTNLVLNVQDHVSENFRLQVGSVSQSMTVFASEANVNTTDASLSTMVDRQFAENLPLNGRSFQTLIQLTPGVVLTASNPYDNGQFSVNGQRADANYWMVDGVSANVGIGTSTSNTGNGVSGTNAALSVLGGTNSLVSVDALQEFRIQTSTFAPEFGRTPGGQISIVTRSGTNQFHGSAFDYLRNDIVDANDWFGNANHLSKPEERQNDFGGTLAGPIVRNRTFFFFSYEGLRLRLPEVAESLVPDMKARQTAVPAMQPYLNTFPTPTPNTPDDLTNEIAQFNSSFSNAATLDAFSLRVDHRVSDKVTLFGRYNYSPSMSSQRGGDSGSLATVTPSKITLQTATAGLTAAFSGTVVDDLRINYSRTTGESHTYMDQFGGGIPLASLPFPGGFNPSNAVFFLPWDNLGLYQGIVDGFQGHNLQRQFNVVDNLTIQKGLHNLKVGVDFRRLSPVFGNLAYSQEADFCDVPSSTTGTFCFAAVSSGRGGNLFFHNLGTFAQDTWRVTPALTLTYGLRWDVDFAPSSNPSLLAASGFDLSNLSNLAVAPAGTPPFQTTYGNVAPRIGVAYRIAGDQTPQTVLRGGFGLFYDLATSEVGNSFNYLTYPFGASTHFSSGTFPFDSTSAAPPAITIGNLRSQGNFGMFDPQLKLPYTFQWNVSLEQALGAQQTLSISYVGAAGRRLIQSALFNHPNPNFRAIRLTTNSASSDYNALQTQFQRRLSKGLQALASYTWSHSIDTASAGSVFGSTANALLPGLINQNRGPSDFDIRNAFSAGLTYSLPANVENRVAKSILEGWSLQNVVQARSAPPVSIFDGSFSFLLNRFAQVRPDLIPGQPLYLYGAQYPGGKAFNLGAFIDPPLDANGNPSRQGDLGRNALRAFGAWQWDFAVHRDFPIHESVKLEFRAEMFNVLNHPSFGPPTADLSNKTQFGRATQMLGQSLNGGNFGSNLGGGGFDPLYQIGGPRSIQAALKLFF
jgi:hypothetical protein